MKYTVPNNKGMERLLAPHSFLHMVYDFPDSCYGKITELSNMPSPVMSCLTACSSWLLSELLAEFDDAAAAAATAIMSEELTTGWLDWRGELGESRPLLESGGNMSSSSSSSA